MRQQDARIQHDAVRQRRQLAGEPLHPQLLQQASHQRAGRVPLGRAREAALLAEQPHAAGGLPFEMRPRRARHATRHQDLRVRVAQQRHECAVGRQRQRLPRRQRLADRRRRRLAQREHGQVRGRVEIERRPHRPRQHRHLAPRLVPQPPREHIVPLERPHPRQRLRRRPRRQVGRVEVVRHGHGAAPRQPLPHRREVLRRQERQRSCAHHRNRLRPQLPDQAQHPLPQRERLPRRVVVDRVAIGAGDTGVVGREHDAPEAAVARRPRAHPRRRQPRPRDHPLGRARARAAVQQDQRRPVVHPESLRA